MNYLIYQTGYLQAMQDINEPKAVVYENENETFKGIKKYLPLCPNCKEIIKIFGDCRCCSCGQKLVWEPKNEKE